MEQGSYHDPHFTGGETEAQRGAVTGQSHTLEGWEPLSEEQLTYDAAQAWARTSRATCSQHSVSAKLAQEPHWCCGMGVGEGAHSPAHRRPRPRRNTHLEHDFVDSSSVRFKVEVFIVVIA